MKRLLVIVSLLCVAALLLQPYFATRSGHQGLPSVIDNTDALNAASVKVNIDSDQGNGNLQNWLNDSLGALFDFYISYYEQGENEMWQAFNQYCDPLPYCASLTELFSRYVDYKKRLVEFEAGPLQVADSFSIRLENIESLQGQMFTHEEIEALFANSNQWDRYAIERLAIQQDETISQQQKSDLITRQLMQLPEEMRIAVGPTQQLRLISTLLTEGEPSSSHTFNQLAAEFGQDAAQRLIDTQTWQKQWRERVENYRHEAEKLRATLSGTAILKESLTSLKRRSFTDNELKRLAVYLINAEM